MKKSLRLSGLILLAVGSVSCSTFSEVYHSDPFYRPPGNVSKPKVTQPTSSSQSASLPKSPSKPSWASQTISSPEQKSIRRLESLSAPTTPSISAPELPKASSYPVAVPIAGKPGYVYNPYNNNPVFVEGIPGGKTVRDPKDPNTNHKFILP